MTNAKPRATMKDVAALSGVSLKTVSRVVNEESPVSDDLRTRVLKAIDQLDYRHNWAASNLRRRVGRARVLGVLLQDLANSFSSGLLRALEDACHERGIALLAASLDEEPDRERLLVADLVSRRVDGLVLMPATEQQRYLEAELRAGLPTVFVDRRPRGVDADSVTVDNLAGGYDAARHLLQHGHRRIAVLSDLLTITTAQHRIEGVHRAMREASVEPDPALVRTDIRTSEDAELILADLLAGEDPPTGVIALRNILSIGTLRAVRYAGASGRVAVVGFDDFPTAELMDLTVIRQDVAQLGARAAELVLGRLDGEDSPPQHVVVPHTLIERGSGEIAPPARH
ncbi:LacI family DNA-binding transcriptional regulator [Nocardioides speluncae]|uniref:LacI family DNA-binding transcriptional regulator n=1 Tax=Nocardioides speluncae TaxID=2670337 RepID=UPI000D693F31|nr:LacI family DNA-binding transcriptional regulator [Nocardioides speluncae]